MRTKPIFKSSFMSTVTSNLTCTQWRCWPASSAEDSERRRRGSVGGGTSPGTLWSWKTRSGFCYTPPWARRHRQSPFSISVIFLKRHKTLKSLILVIFDKSGCKKRQKMLKLTQNRRTASPNSILSFSRQHYSHTSLISH